jgi:hypothetical protein
VVSQPLIGHHLFLLLPRSPRAVIIASLQEFHCGWCHRSSLIVLLVQVAQVGPDFFQACQMEQALIAAILLMEVNFLVF